MGGLQELLTLKEPTTLLTLLHSKLTLKAKVFYLGDSPLSPRLFLESLI